RSKTCLPGALFRGRATKVFRDVDLQAPVEEERVLPFLDADHPEARDLLADAPLLALAAELRGPGPENQLAESDGERRTVERWPSRPSSPSLRAAVATRTTSSTSARTSVSTLTKSEGIEPNARPRSDGGKAVSRTAKRPPSTSAPNAIAPPPLTSGSAQ